VVPQDQANTLFVQCPTAHPSVSSARTSLHSPGTRAYRGLRAEIAGWGCTFPVPLWVSCRGRILLARGRCCRLVFVWCRSGRGGCGEPFRIEESDREKRKQARKSG